ncbi:MAG: GTP-binding protein [Candidatus Jettenia sp.]|uniref:Cobalamin synthesis protein n=1 Tax=Candidatus Jettenia caeni TaxID=247490 RepID=I3IMU5_9BACT|nr:GTP-binding protein [Candidatus Jettenia sp. AMX1]MBC6928704.1 GTP-binding protein [Candidatus Jettenia sp.]WKZ14792.1 MAG: GTP-binding protein [Candidatus Jettenia caeni]KAA0250680.1 MAG: GTP-binding protein [Candidatus Jettenia sp. AMX1]MCE7880016.1 GTP-binding protein [Candidatus Jettenia sp. AMX1]MCQ3926798.1 GTP-binding protein [Candidatus Jettenia sp.]
MNIFNNTGISLTILTGFLGAGKTTMLNRILNGNHGLKVAVLVNDFGSINIDAELIVGIESNVISLANGCICCTIRDDLIATVMETINRPERPEYILLEASGVAEPSGIAMTFNNPSFRDRIRLDSILCVVDAEQVFTSPEFMDLKLFQMACADMIILNKVDLVGSDQVARIKEWLDSRFHCYRLIEAVQADVPLPVLLSVGRYDPTQADPNWYNLKHHDCRDSHCNQKHHHHDHSNVFGTWSYETDRPLSLDVLSEIVSKLPVNIYRAKGVMYTLDAPERRVILQVVGRRVDISLADEWGKRTPRTQIVAIGAAGAIDEESLRAKFEQCIGNSVAGH